MMFWFIWFCLIWFGYFGLSLKLAVSVWGCCVYLIVVDLLRLLAFWFDLISSFVLELVVLDGLVFGIYYGLGWFVYLVVEIWCLGFVYGEFWWICRSGLGCFCFEWISGIWLVSGLVLFCVCSNGKFAVLMFWLWCVLDNLNNFGSKSWCLALV